MTSTRIKKFKSLGIQNTIDFEVDHHDHNFYAENLVTSNSHSISYAYLAAITVYLKFMHPQEFFLSLLKFAQFEPNPHEDISKISQELGSFDMRLLQPDLNKSDIDFKIEGKDVRYGLNGIKGVSDKVLISLVEFREGSFANKYEVFMTAKQVSLNIGVLSGLIQAGLLDSFVTTNRCRLVLEAQTFNILTEREKRNFVELGSKDDYDIINSIATAYKDKVVADDGRVLISESRFKTFKKKYDPYRKIYDLNKKSIRYANWFFEKQLLGYSYSCNIRQVFDHDDFQSSQEVSEAGTNDRVKFVGSLTDVMKRTSANGNKYAKFEIDDEQGSVTALLMDNRREEKLTNYLNSGKKLPVKDDVVILTGRKADGAVFVDSVTPLQDKIYMKLSQVK